MFDHFKENRKVRRRVITAPQTNKVDWLRGRVRDECLAELSMNDVDEAEREKIEIYDHLEIEAANTYERKMTMTT